MAWPRALLVTGAVLCGVLPPLAGTEAAERFLSAIRDLPLMPGLTETPGSALVFSKPQGRIVEVAAEGAVAAGRVLDFYRRTLPQLGWQPDGDRAFRREGERLGLDLTTGRGGLIVRFSLTPQ